jgi:hypothetical protein
VTDSVGLVPNFFHAYWSASSVADSAIVAQPPCTLMPSVTARTADQPSQMSLHCGGITSLRTIPIPGRLFQLVPVPTGAVLDARTFRGSEQDGTWSRNALKLALLMSLRPPSSPRTSNLKYERATPMPAHSWFAS